MVIRADGKFTRIPKSKVLVMRELKEQGFSLNYISRHLNVAKSTVSCYCRDLYEYPTRIYQLEQEARDAIYLRGVGKDHSKYTQCNNCGRQIRNEHVRCLVCNNKNQKETGEVEMLIDAGRATRFQVGNKMALRRWGRSEI